MTKTNDRVWGCSSAGRAPGLQPGGHRFDPGQLHQILLSAASRRLVYSSGMRIIESIVSLGPFLIPITAFLVGGVITIVVLILRHQERLAKIERGIDPDFPRRQ